MNFAEFLRTPNLKKFCVRLLLVAGWGTTKKLSRRDLLILTRLVYINISVASSFPSFTYDFFIHICLVLAKLNIERENCMENSGRFQNVTPKNETDFLGCAEKYKHVESAD